jgi:tRNA U55 pseudouridine synthase TruB
MSARPYDKDEIARRGEDLYERRVREEEVEAEGANEGLLLAIGVESGDYTRSQTTRMGLARGCAAGGPTQWST